MSNNKQQQQTNEKKANVFSHFKHMSSQSTSSTSSPKTPIEVTFGKAASTRTAGRRRRSNKNRRSSRATSPETSVKAHPENPSLHYITKFLNRDRLSEVLEVNEEDQIIQSQRKHGKPTPSYNDTHGRQRRDRRSRFKTPTNFITSGARHNRTGRVSAQRPHNVGSNGWA